jgi:protein O-mannosyl-transferase
LSISKCRRKPAIPSLGSNARDLGYKTKGQIFLPEATTSNAAAAHSPEHAVQVPSLGRLRWLGVLVALVTSLAFLPVLGNGWVDRDDTENFLDNPSFRGIGLAQLRWAFSTFYLGVYQPLAWILLGAQYELCGLMPWGYHLASVGLHCANVVALMTLAAAVLKHCVRTSLPKQSLDERSRKLGAATAALLFAVHPLRVEAVAWASCQPYLPCAFFAMLAVLAYLRRDSASVVGKVTWLATAWALYILALLCKAAALTLPVVLLVLDAFPLRRFSGAERSRRASILAAVLEKLPFAAVGLLFFALAVGGKYVSNPALVSEDSLWIVQRLARSFYSAGFYIEKSAWPSGLSANYEWPDEASVFDRWFAAPALGAVGVTLIAVATSGRWPGLAAAWFAYLLLMVPVSGFVRSGFTVVADRYAYLATIPLFVALSYSMALVWASIKPPRAVAPAIYLVMVAIAFGLISLSWRLSLTWRNSHALITRAAAAGTLSQPTYLVTLGKLHERNHEFDEAESCFRQAVQLAPSRPDVVDDLGSYLYRREKLAEALALFERSIQIDPRFVLGYNHLGLSLALQGRVNEAAQRFETALSLHPYYVEARLNLASLLRHQGELKAAAEHYGLILGTDPDNLRALSGLQAIADELVRSRAP